jgi:pimeloyl-ACP methyl ester carboxylesterase
MRSLPVVTPDGLSISAQLWGNASGPEILFIHGLMQSHLSWAAQTSDVGLARDFRMVTYDLRGHGSSDKPDDPDRYRTDSAWADEVAAVMAAAGLRRPVVVVWSFGGRVLTDYLRTYGQDHLAGINFVGAVSKSGEEYLGPAIKLTVAAFSSDLATRIEATRAFLRACFERQPSQETFETALAYNMVVPPHVRAAAVDRPPNPGDLLPTLRLLVLVTHGAQDPFMLPTLARFTAAKVPGARLSLYENVGHSPFQEDSQRFNSELAAFVRQANT